MKAPTPARGDLLVGAPSCAVYRKDVALSFFRSLSPHSANGHVCFKNVLQAATSICKRKNKKKHVVDCGSNQSSILAQPRREPHSHKVTCKGRQLETISFGGRCAHLPEISFFLLKIQDMSTEALTLLNLTLWKARLNAVMLRWTEPAWPATQRSCAAWAEKDMNTYEYIKDYHYISNPNIALSIANHSKRASSLHGLILPTWAIYRGAIIHHGHGHPWINKGYTADQQPEQDMAAVDGWEKHWSDKAGQVEALE